MCLNVGMGVGCALVSCLLLQLLIVSTFGVYVVNNNTFGGKMKKWLSGRDEEGGDMQEVIMG